ncbi:hypothetical protein BFN03_01525 [Rhodococcus sp. WMMA185]|uniref:hypothetical protein n=1 Tax=Rhodococcus sp. WMMA185 TaxID=679318 RepID=UPI000878666C|nr:hypothetical protein [Rhodococcus sp. WMMA185]AOW91817.1 hypothetical protein BFN03_01525 [Rhodococcus sp. WMMA185]
MRLRNVLGLVDPGAESPPETRTRFLLIRAGLPAPSTQIPIADLSGRIFARADMGWERWRVLVELTAYSRRALPCECAEVQETIRRLAAELRIRSGGAGAERYSAAIHLLNGSVNSAE